MLEYHRRRVDERGARVFQQLSASVAPRLVLLLRLHLLLLERRRKLLLTGVGGVVAEAGNKLREEDALLLRVVHLERIFGAAVPLEVQQVKQVAKHSFFKFCVFGIGGSVESIGDGSDELFDDDLVCVAAVCVKMKVRVSRDFLVKVHGAFNFFHRKAAALGELRYRERLIYEESSTGDDVAPVVDDAETHLFQHRFGVAGKDERFYIHHHGKFSVRRRKLDQRMFHRYLLFVDRVCRCGYVHACVALRGILLSLRTVSSLLACFCL